MFLFLLLCLYPHLHITSLADNRTTISPTPTSPTGPTSPGQGGASLAWVAAPVLLLVLVAVAVLCGVWFHWLYTAGERRYWGRVHNEHLRATGSGAGSSSARHDNMEISRVRQSRDSSEETDESMDNDRRGLFSWNV